VVRLGAAVVIPAVIARENRRASILIQLSNGAAAFLNPSPVSGRADASAVVPRQ
jgi:hypothetical protein